ncbi:MAG: hypothetical protein JNM24_08540 [Bdellovibrionaceae bacterium]|nr:hypothetical protein [Pseudobdellovibrionaceae bacterium]
MNLKKTRLTIVRCLSVTLTSVLLIGCGSETEVDKIGDAQQCLNSATSTTAMDCVTKVDGLSSTGAYNIRCAAAFVREGFANPTKYTNAFSNLNNGQGTANFMGLVSFSSTGSITTDASNANTTFNDCYKANAKGKTLISAFGYFSTALLNFFSGTNASACKAPTSGAYNLETCMQQAAIANPQYLLDIASTSTADSSPSGLVQTSIGSVIISTYNISCSGAGANKELCATLEKAITAGGSNPRTVFTSFFSTSVKP